MIIALMIRRKCTFLAVIDLGIYSNLRGIEIAIKLANRQCISNICNNHRRNGID